MRLRYKSPAIQLNSSPEYPNQFVDSPAPETNLIMLSVSSVFTSLLLASAGTAAASVKARADTLCHPAVAGKQINIVNGQYQLGYPAGAYFPNVPVEAEALTIPLAPVFNVDPSGNGLLTSESYILWDDSHTEFLNSFANAPAGSVLYPTINSNLTQVLLEPRITTFPGNTTQTWFFTCDVCDSGIAYGCEVQSAGTGQCTQIGTAVGQTTSVASCTGLDYGSQIFTLYIS
ncbi:hypothetical protein K438DRAFT_1994310 [Mycena galopus ATCC 62051]|nr:hypothetical protein K438DRAFT_1994310 [Mycena galopus ATCC 62051]